MEKSAAKTMKRRLRIPLMWRRKFVKDKMAGVGVGISDDLISLEIGSPDLTLIDLPGIAVKGQPENIGEQIKRLIRKFITKQETINLVVVPCNVDIATTEALKMAQEVDPEGERTLGILTKPDLVDKGTEEMVVDIVHNEVIHLTKGYMIVKCRGQKEIMERVSLTEATEREKAFFKEHAHLSTLYDEGHATIPKLAEKLTIELVHHIEKSLPRLEEQIEAKLSETHAELERYGTGPPEDSVERLYFLIDKVTAFTQDAINLSTGEEMKSEVRLNVFSTLRQEFGKWKLHLDRSGENFNQRIEGEVADYEKTYRGRELPGFINYKTFEVMVKDQIKQLEEPAVKKLKEISVYTQDTTYSHSLSERKREEDEDRPLTEIRSTIFSTDNHATLQEMMLHLKSYYRIASQRLADQIPMVIRYLVVQEFASQLQREMLQTLQEKDNIEQLLKEDFDIGSKRAALQNKLKRLMKARSYLVEF
ncbi:interferon-induced GTP-binding protein Mx3-like isoform X2 [Oncorhynchus masou masou]|uniref:interferon-induced GTP-binding protein Mx3-like isoform X2 n=1 Tax=Oncorhynchus masou masou TaxID=90313 RepID=UPI0031846414